MIALFMELCSRPVLRYIDPEKKEKVRKSLWSSHKIFVVSDIARIH